MSEAENLRPCLPLVRHEKVLLIGGRASLRCSLDGLDTVARLRGDRSCLCDEGAVALCSTAQFCGSCEVPCVHPSTAPLAREDSALVLDVVNGLVHEGLDEVALVLHVSHRAEVEHEFHCAEFNLRVQDGCRGSEVSSCASCVGSCEDDFKCVATHVEVVSEDVKSLSDDACDFSLQRCLAYLLDEYDGR